MPSAMNQTCQVLASSVSKVDGPFTCPMCMCEVLVKKGRVKIHHFAHIPPTICAYGQDRKSTRLNSSHSQISYAVFCLKKKKTDSDRLPHLPTRHMHQQLRLRLRTLLYH